MCICCALACKPPRSKAVPFLHEEVQKLQDAFCLTLHRAECISATPIS